MSEPDTIANGTEPAHFDIIFAGGGLANVLAAYRLSKVRPDLRCLVLEANNRFGAQQTWSFHSTDLTQDQMEWMRPFIAQSWDRQKVTFPKRNRTLDVGYNTITGEKFHTHASATLADKTRFASTITQIEPNRVTLDDGSEFSAACVIDGRGAETDPNLTIAFQKFFGLEIQTKNPHGETIPTIMDATVPQLDGYRFVYLLPYDTHRILVEDTYYSDDDTLTKDALRERVHAYVDAKGWEVEVIEREEHGVLPVTLDGDIKAFTDGWQPDVARSGMRAGIFHLTTGYSLPDAVRFADALAQQPQFEAGEIAKFARSYTKQLWNERSYFRMLNRTLFLAAAPEQRYRILERFYGLSQNLISRFYASNLTWADQVRILFGKPPVSPLAAVRSLPPSALKRYRQ